MSTFEDCQRFLTFVVNCFADKPFRVDEARLARLKSASASASVGDSHGGGGPLSNGGHLGGETDHRRGEADPFFISSSCGEEIIVQSPQGAEQGRHNNSHTLTNIFIYPIKSCAAFEVRTVLYRQGMPMCQCAPVPPTVNYNFQKNVISKT